MESQGIGGSLTLTKLSNSVRKRFMSLFSGQLMEVFADNGLCDHSSIFTSCMPENPAILELTDILSLKEGFLMNLLHKK